MIINNKLVELPREGKAIIITDLHGNLTDFELYESIWKDFLEEHNHVIITGDFIHPTNQDEDGSIEILELLMEYSENYHNFHVLLGNHEWSHLAVRPIYKLGMDQRLDFEKKVKDKYGNKWQQKMGEYLNFFKNLSIAVRTENKVFISHAGPSNNIKSINDIINITCQGYNNQKLYDMLWNEYPNYNLKDLIMFLKNIACNVQIVGHTPVDGVKIIGEKLLIVSSSDTLNIKTDTDNDSKYSSTSQNIFKSNRKAYVELDLTKNIKNIYDIINMVKYI